MVQARLSPPPHLIYCAVCARGGLGFFSHAQSVRMFRACAYGTGAKLRYSSYYHHCSSIVLLLSKNMLYFTALHWLQVSELLQFYCRIQHQIYYHSSHLSLSGFIGDPFLQLKALANSSLFTMAPFTLYIRRYINVYTG